MWDTVGKEGSGKKGAQSTSTGPTKYVSTDSCGLNTTHNTSTVVMSDDDTGESKRMWCAVWNPTKGQGGEWDSGGCSVVGVAYDNSSSSSSNNGSNADAAVATNDTAPVTTVFCNCLVAIPPRKSLADEDNFDIEVSLSIVEYVFSRVAKSFDFST